MEIGDKADKAEKIVRDYQQIRTKFGPRHTKYIPLFRRDDGGPFLQMSQHVSLLQLTMIRMP